jgi:hypothetical protein
MIQGHPDLGWRQRYNALGTEEWARFEPGGPTPEALEAAAKAVASIEASTAQGTPGNQPSEQAAPDA